MGLLKEGYTLLSKKWNKMIRKSTSQVTKGQSDMLASLFRSLGLKTILKIVVAQPMNRGEYFHLF